jgi:hypothetical protein
LAQQQQQLLAQQQKQEHMQKCLDNLTFAGMQKFFFQVFFDNNIQLVAVFTDSRAL